MFAAVLDTCVLWPSLQRDFLLSMAVEGLYRPLWSQAILEELHDNEQQKLIDRGQEVAAALAAADFLVREMSRAFDDALVVGWEPLDGSYGHPDPNDEHVVAAAVVGGAGAIVTDNLVDFPVDRMPPSIQVIRARDFAANTADVDPERAALALHAIATRHTKSSHSPGELLELLVTRYGMSEVGEILRPVLDGIVAPD
jgi:hypothetical protein